MNEPSLHDLPDEGDLAECIVDLRDPIAAFDMDKPEYLRKLRKIGPRPARKMCLLDQIDAALKRIAKENTIPGELSDEVQSPQRGPDEVILTETELELVGIAATLSLLLREEWTYA